MSKQSEAGKGSKLRPYSVDQKTFNDNWEKIFNKNSYQDVLSTEDTFLNTLENFDDDETN
jgi:hypothetical protein